MDVAKYIGIFLLKNNFVYIHGLGNLELRKKPATYDGDSLRAPSYEVLLTPSGSIDDNLANFIANNEQTSISKASNALREFSIQAKTELQAGKEVEIPSIGKFTEVNGRISFTTNPGFQHTPPNIPTIKMAKRQNEPVFGSSAATSSLRPRASQPLPQQEVETYEEESGGSINWVRVGIAAAVLIVLIAAVYFIISYMSGNNATKEAPLILPPPSTEEQPVNQTPDTTAAVAPEPTMPQLLSFDVRLHTYNDLPKAIARVNRLRGLGQNVQMEANADSTLFYIILPIEDIAPADTAKLMDSLKVNYNMKATIIKR